MISQSLPQLLNCTINVVSVFVSMLVLSLPLTAVAIGMVLVVLFATKKLGRLSGRYFVAQQKDLGSVNGFIEEHDGGPEGGQGLLPRGQGAWRSLTRRNEALFHSAQNANTLLQPAYAPLRPAGQRQLCALRHDRRDPGPGRHRRLSPWAVWPAS